MIFSLEQLSPELFSEMLPLLQGHAGNISHYNKKPIDPDFSTYLTLKDANALRVYTARDDEKLVGYSVFVIYPHIHSKQSLQANEDLIYILPEYRKGISGYSFIKWCDEALATEGVKTIYRHVPVAHDFSPLLSRQGYSEVETIFAKEVM